MNRIFLVFFLVALSLNIYAVGGIDGGGGAGKVAIAIKNTPATGGHDVDLEDDSSAGIEQFREIVKLNSSKRELVLDTRKIKIANVTDYRKPNASGTPVNSDPLTRFRRMSETGDVTVLFIDFESVKEVNGVVVFKLKKDWGTSLKVYQIRQGGEVTQESFEYAWDLKDCNPESTSFSIDLIIESDPIISEDEEQESEG